MRYEQQKCRRFAILSFDDANALGVAEVGGGGFGYCICDMSSSPPRYLGDDHCEPEDALLVRDFAWVADALNELSAELQTKGEALAEMQRERDELLADCEQLCRDAGLANYAEHLKRRKEPSSASASPAKLGGPVDAFREELVEVLRDVSSAVNQEGMVDAATFALLIADRLERK